MEPSITFIHAADLHLDSPFKGLTDLPEPIFSKVKESTFIALDHLVKTAVARDVDFVLLVGDLFDHERQSLKAQVRLRDACKELEKHGINVYISYGNHDYLRGNMYPITYPENVYIFDQENVSACQFEKNGEKVASIYGFSYENRAVTVNKTKEYIINDESIPFHIATLHGTLYGNDAHEPYAPFQLSDLQHKGFDYWALGHIHRREVLSESPPIIYPGNIQGRHRKEAGEKGCYLVELSKTTTYTEFIPLHAIEFKSVTIDVSNCQQIDEVEREIKHALEQANTCRLIHLTLSADNDELHKFEHEGLIRDVIDILNESFYFPEQWQYIYQYRIEVQRKKIDVNNQFFVAELEDAMEQLSVQETLADLYHHSLGRKFLDNVSEYEIKQEANKYLFHQLLNVRGE